MFAETLGEAPQSNDSLKGVDLGSKTSQKVRASDRRDARLSRTCYLWEEIKRCYLKS